jgi:hypothetical protein
MPITESGITLNFPDNNYFRLEDCDGYKKIQSNFSEMDACWYDQVNDTLYLIELKDWGNNNLQEENDPDFSETKISEMKEGISKHRIYNLLKKSIDTTCMFMSILLGKPYAANIQACSPFTITNKTKVNLLSIINWTDADSSYISNINTVFKTKFHSYARLFDIKAFLVLTKEKAAEKFDWIS